jgi:hypothetical protein
MMPQFLHSDPMLDRATVYGGELGIENMRHWISVLWHTISLVVLI